MTALVRSGSHVVQAHANWSQWAAKCDVCPWGGAFSRGTPHFECPFCGALNEIVWPSEDMMNGVERLLMMRPDPSKRNWWPHETLHDLMFENGVHGIFDNLPEELEATPGVALFGVDDFRIRHDRLPAIEQPVRKALT